MKKSIVWGTCWFNEPIETLVEFYKSSIKSLQKMNFKVIPVIFDAKYNKNNNKELNYITKNIDDVIIIKNNINIFPNKNYGVALISNKAFDLMADYVAIVDSDWSIKENYSFIENILLTLIKSDYDIIIPNIGNASGRSNILVGKTAISLFYPDFLDIIITAFPGSVVAKTSKLRVIVNDENYHFDWGGEWDIISIAINHNMKINSAFVEVENIRHRPNTSKILDGFQIWRAILGNSDMTNRFKYLKQYNKEILPYDDISRNVLEHNCSILDLINILENDDATDTEKQILYMILYPIAFLTGKITKLPVIESSNKIPYNKEELNTISDFAIYCAKIALYDVDVQEMLSRCKTAKCEFLSEWNFEIQKQLLKEGSDYNK